MDREWADLSEIQRVTHLVVLKESQKVAKSVELSVAMTADHLAV